MLQFELSTEVEEHKLLAEFKIAIVPFLSWHVLIRLQQVSGLKVECIDAVGCVRG